MSPTSKIAICDLKGANMKKMKKMKKFLYSMEKLFHFLHFFHFFPRLNRKTRFSRSEILKNLNICPSKDRHLTCYTCYPFADFLHYGVMDLVQSFWSLFVWILAMGKIQKEPVRVAGVTTQTLISPKGASSGS